MENLNLILVFIEGLLSFLSPCVLPIMPIYLSILSNSSVDILKENNLKSFENGVYHINGEDLFVNIVEYTTTTIENRFFETHKKYSARKTTHSICTIRETVK